ncbi:hypothetical protein FCM35_KLT18252 [Carex littledalei]|uniref:F-box/LRR-repeat protein 15/At3g58940/PEG3-like LRR domain-containing protein n=1 Tax=Carex littledalei TaxID=544730 RepID=A0A833VQQ2_9POAL|nr:hypothetical protein FCM35_KLT18252 [Carex littledalei]
MVGLTILNTTNSLYDTPLSVFNCNTIVKPNMFFCRLVVPLQLTGLRSVKSLMLAQVIVVDDDLQRMILWCNAMKKLSIIDCLEVNNIVICAPSLSELVIRLVWPARVVLQSVP